MSCRRTHLRRSALGLAIALATTACEGPQLHVHNPDDHAVFLDGKRVYDETVEFRFYGTSRFDTLPLIAEEHGVPRFEHTPSSEQIDIPQPFSPWLFPLDFPLEVIDRMFAGRRDQTVTIVAKEKPLEERITVEIPQEELGRLSARGRQARVTR